jgi:hypothetical protein
MEYMLRAATNMQKGGAMQDDHWKETLYEGVLKQISERPRNTIERRLARSCLEFAKAMEDEKKKNAMFNMLMPVERDKPSRWKRFKRRWSNAWRATASGGLRGVGYQELSKPWPYHTLEAQEKALRHVGEIMCSGGLVGSPDRVPSFGQQDMGEKV